MTVSAANDVIELNADPYPMLRRLRDEMPLHYNAEHDFYAISRFPDIDSAGMGHDAGRSPLRRTGSNNELR